MKRLLGLVTLLIACSSGTEAGSGDSSAAGALPIAHAGVSGAVSRTAGEGGGGANAGSAPLTAGSPAALAGAGGEPGEGGESSGGAPSAGAAAGSSGSTNQAGSQAAGNGGAAGNVGSAGTGGAAGSSTAGAAGTQSAPDPCAGAIHWDKNERWAELVTGTLRHFAGSLWKCQAADYCRFYPGNGEPNGWVAVAECSSGPVKEPECQCTTGTCCDGCYIRPPSYFCGEVVRYARCTGKAPLSCPGSKPDIEGDYWNLFCDGNAPGECTRWGAHTKFAGAGQCGSMGLVCVEQGDQASCAACN